MSGRTPTVAEPRLHGLQPDPSKGGGRVLFAVGMFIRGLESNYARPGGRRVEAAPAWPSATFDDRFRFAAEKLWDTIWKVNRVAELIHMARCNIRDLQPPSVPVEEMGRHMAALRDIPIYFETLIVYLRVVADCIANLTPYLYGLKRKTIPPESFREQRDWFISKRSKFDSAYAGILKAHTRWFDVLAGDPPRFIGLRDAIIHYRGGIQIVYKPQEGGAPAKLMPMLYSDHKTLTLDLFKLLQRVTKEMCIFFDRYVEHFNRLASEQTKSEFLNLTNPDSITLFRYEGELPSAWLYPILSVPDDYIGNNEC
jgi:hypothetical protein